MSVDTNAATNGDTRVLTGKVKRSLTSKLPLPFFHDCVPGEENWS